MMAYKYIITLVLLLVSLGCEQVDIGNGTETGSNDNFSNATVLSGNNIDLTVSFNGATTELGEPNTSGVGGEGTIWYRWTAPYTGNVTIYAAYSGIVYGYTGNNLANLVLVYNGSGSSSSSDTNNISVDAGVIYYFKLSGSSYSVDLFNFFLYADQPAYDNFNTRQTIIGNSGALNNQTLLNATFEADEPYYGPIWYGSTTRQHDGSIWLTWTAPTTGLFDVTLNETYYNSIPSAEIHIYKGNSLVDLVHGTFVDVLHNSGGAFGVIAGQTYQLQITGPSKTRILNYPGYPPDYLPDYGPEFNILWNTVTDFPANDFFSQATLITGETGSLLHQTLTKATKEIGEPVTSYASIWYEWTAGYTGRIQFNAQGIATNQAYAFPVNMTVYTGTDVSSLTEISSNNSNNSLTANVVSGVTYKIRIGSENRCSIRSDGNYCTTEVSSTSPIGGIDDFNLSWLKI